MRTFLAVRHMGSVECVTVHVRVRKERGGAGTRFVVVDGVRNLEGRRRVIFGGGGAAEGACDVDMLVD